MKKLLAIILVMAVCSCKQMDHKEETVVQPKIVELVLWKAKANVTLADSKKVITNLNAFVNEQSGFISRSTAVSEEGQYLDVVYWADMESAIKASENSLTSDICLAAFETIEDKEMTLLHFEVFNRYAKYKAH